MIQALYVDDEPSLLEIGKLFLEFSHEMEVDTETSAPKALQKLKSREYQVIISDYQMPGMDGIKFLKTVRKECRKIPFILFTGRGREEVAIEALNFGADFYLQKGGDAGAQFAVLKNMIFQAVQRKDAEDELKKSEERYRNVVEDQTECICRFLPDGTNVFVNTAYCSFLGKDRADLIGKKFIPEVPAEDEVRLKKHFLSLTPENPKASIEHRIVMPDGTIRWVRCNDRAIFGEDGRVKEYQSVARDITGQKEAECACRESERRLRYTLDFFPDAFYAINLEGKIIAWNKAAADLTGVPADRMIGKSGYEYSVAFYGARHPTLVDLILDPGKRELAPYREIRKTEGSTLITESHVIKGGTRTPVWIKAAPIYDREGRITGAIEAVHEISSYTRARKGSHPENKNPRGMKVS